LLAGKELDLHSESEDNENELENEANDATHEGSDEGEDEEDANQDEDEPMISKTFLQLRTATPKKQDDSATGKSKS
jgi:hypothetical protein